jgi:ribosomal protein S12 methylthiotransferase
MTNTSYYPPKVGFASLGCPKALTDSERILTQLDAKGYCTSKTFAGADLVIVNTCGFIDDAVKESLDTIGEALADNGKVIVTGCLGAKKSNNGGNLVQELHSKVLAVTGPNAIDEVLAAVDKHLPIAPNPFTDLQLRSPQKTSSNVLPGVGVKLTPRHYAYLKISEGCNHRCTFCIIPSMRGTLVSQPIGQVLTQAQALFAAGVKELLVISQDTSAYGVDKKYQIDFWDGRPLKTRLYELVYELGQLALEYGAWVRLHYVYPYPHIDEILPLMAEGLILPYLDVPLQHSHPDILKRMKRPASGEKNLERIQQWRQVCPELVIRSTFIVGFPGETKNQFHHLLQFIDEAGVDHAGCFAYSPVEGAVANSLPNPVPIALRKQRQISFMEKANSVAENRLQKRIGCTMQLLLDKVGIPKEPEQTFAIGRSYADAPEVDGLVYLLPPLGTNGQLDKSYHVPKIGEFIDAEIVSTHGHDLIAIPTV